MHKHVIVALLAIAGIGYVVVDELFFAEPTATSCCANGFDATPYETTPIRP